MKTMMGSARMLPAAELNRCLTGMTALLPRLLGRDLATRIRTDGRVGRVLLEWDPLEQVLLCVLANVQASMPRGAHLVASTELAEVGTCGGMARVEPGLYAAVVVTNSASGPAAPSEWCSRRIEAVAADLFAAGELVAQSGGLLQAITMLDGSLAVVAFVPCAAPAAVAVAGRTEGTRQADGRRLELSRWRTLERTVSHGT
jgi:hypothetical protein